MNRVKFTIVCMMLVFAGAIVRSGNSAPAAFLPAPRSVSASDGDHFDKVSISWNAVRGATTYRIFRNTIDNHQTATDLGTTVAGYFFDFTAVVGQNYFYWVRAENGGTVSDLGVPEQGRRAAGSASSTIFSPLSPPPVPGANQVTAAKAMLGKTLFWDEQLSSTRTVACGTCHRPASGGSDPRTVVGSNRSRNPGFDNTFNTADDVFGSPGVIGNNADGTLAPTSLFGLNEQVTGRKAPSYINVGITTNGTFWDGRASNTFRDPLTNVVLFSDWGGLESQSVGPPMSAVEMAHAGRDWTGAAARIAASRPLALASSIPASMLGWIDNRTYPELFTEAFGTPDVTPARIAMAIATHERTLFSDRTPLDRWATEIEPLTAQEDRGRDVFVSVNCSFCHGGPVLADQNFHNVGVRPTNEDPGRGAISGVANDNGRFKTPTLRNVELRGPYFHNGRFATLEEVVEFYNRGGDFNAGNINRGLIRALNLTTQQKADLVAFLKRPLTDPRVRDELPPFDRPKLFTESNRVPETVGTGRAGTGGTTPQPVAIEPPFAGNPSFAVGLSAALPNATVTLVIDAADPGVGAVVPASGSFARIVRQSDAGGFASATLPIPADPAIVGRTFYGRWYVADAGAANGFSVTAAFRFTVFPPASITAPETEADFDGDGRTDFSIFRPSVAEWWISRSANGGNFAARFGGTADRIAPTDFTGDGRTDIAFWRAGEWFVFRSEDSSYYSFPFGSPGDIPVPGDFDGDGKSDAAVFRPSSSTWFISLSAGGTIIRQFGAAGDRPLPADFDGDGRRDIAVYRTVSGEWWIERSSGGVIAFQFGTSADIAIPADFTGDRRADAAIWRPTTGEWFVLRSEDSSYFSFVFGVNSDVPSVGDFDGDSLADAVVFRSGSGTWYVNGSGGTTLIRQFGVSGDIPLPSVTAR